MYYYGDDSAPPDIKATYGHNVHIAEGSMGSGWGQSVSIILDSPNPGRWFAAMALLDGVTVDNTIKPKVTQIT